MVPYLLSGRGTPAVALVHGGAVAPAWMTGPDAYESFVAGGVRGLIDRSPMRYDVAIYCGGGS